MAHREDVGLVAGLADERVVGRDAPVVAHAQELAGVVVAVLRPIDTDGWARAGSADRHVEQAILADGDARDFRVHVIGDEDVAHVGQRLAVPCAAQNRVLRHRSLSTVGAYIGAHGLVVRDVDPSVLREARVQRDVHQPGHRAERRDRRGAGHGGGVELTVPHDSQPTDLLGDQHVAARQKCQAPRV
jgi:hypothetical protein